MSFVCAQIIVLKSCCKNVNVHNTGVGKGGQKVTTVLFVSGNVDKMMLYYNTFLMPLKGLPLTEYNSSSINSGLSH